MKKDIKILYAAFKGKTNTANLLLDNICSENKLYLTNSFSTSVNEFEKALKKEKYDLVILFGQLRLKLDTIQIETIAKIDEDTYKTNYNYFELKKKLESKYKVIVTTKENNYLCNNIYYHSLRFVEENKLMTDILFIHLPKVKNISNIIDLANIFDELNG